MGEVLFVVMICYVGFRLCQRWSLVSWRGEDGKFGLILGMLIIFTNTIFPDDISDEVSS